MSTPNRKRNSSSTSELKTEDLSCGEAVALDLKRALLKIGKAQEEFTKAVQHYSELERDVELRINNTKKQLEEQHTIRTRAMEDLDGEFERQKKRKRIDLEHDIRQHGMEQVKILLEEHRQIALPRDDYQSMIAELETLRRLKQEGANAAEAAAQEKYKVELKTKIESLQLRHAAELASVNARADQQQNQIKLLEDMLVTYRADLDKSRELTKEIAYAQNSRPHNHNNNNHSNGPTSGGSNSNSRS